MNVLAIFVSAVACFVIGFFFHGPLFGKTWMRLANITPTGDEKMSGMWKQMLTNFIMNLILGFVLAGVIWAAGNAFFMGEIYWYKGVIIAAWMWLGFAVPWTMMDVIWMKKSWKLWLFDATSALVCMMAMGAILAAWK